jgi:2-dehydropantoate 2-reductase
MILAIDPVPMPPETIARAGEGDLAALKTYDDRRLSRVGRVSPDQRSSMGQDMAKAGAPRSNF